MERPVLALMLAALVLLLNVAVPEAQEKAEHKTGGEGRGWACAGYVIGAYNKVKRAKERGTSQGGQERDLLQF